MSATAAPAGGEVALALFIVLPLAIFVAYALAALVERQKGQWSGWRLASFAIGIALIMVAAAPPVAMWAHHDLRGHMVQHLLLGMYAPVALVLGAPVTLLLRRLPRAGGRAVTALLTARPARFLVHPVTAGVLDIGGMYGLYLTPLYALSLSEPAVHVLLHVHFVLSGYLFAWAIAGPDPAPRRPGFAARLLVLFLGMAAHATLAKLMYAEGHPLGVAASAAEWEGAAQLMYYGGDVAELLLAIALFAAWSLRRALPRKRFLNEKHSRPGAPGGPSGRELPAPPWATRLACPRVGRLAQR